MAHKRRENVRLLRRIVCFLFILSLFWAAMTRNGALAGILVGAVTVVIWKQGGWLGLYEIIQGFIFAALA